jgi:uncharacterized membrane protein (DUF373 family)
MLVRVDNVAVMSTTPENRKVGSSTPDVWIQRCIQAIELAIVVSLLVVAVVVLARTIEGFFRHWGAFPETVVAAIDGILVVVILIDIANTVFGQLRTSTFPVRPFLVVAILAGVREILSSSAHLTLSRHLSQEDFRDTLLSLSVGVGVVFVLIVSLWILHRSGEDEVPNPRPG